MDPEASKGDADEVRCSEVDARGQGASRRASRRRPLDSMTQGLPASARLPQEIIYRSYRDEDSDLPAITRLVETELSEPYTVRRAGFPAPHAQL